VHFRFGRPSPAMVVAMMALLVALSGVGYAALKLEKDTVGAKQIKRNAVRTAELRDGGVQAADLGGGSVGSNAVLDESLTGGDVQDESIGSTEILDGSVRPGEIEDNSLTGGDVQDEGLGTSDISGLIGADFEPGTFLGGNVTTQFEQAATPLADNSSASYDVHCPDGQTALGGAARGDATDSEFTNVTSSRPKISTANAGAPVDGGTFTGWRVTVLNPSGGAPPGGDILPQVWVICARVP
jgi:hypothetical protein